MNRIRLTALLVLAILGVSCEREPSDGLLEGTGRIVLEMKSSNAATKAGDVLTRAEDTEDERTVSHLDIFIYPDGDAGTLTHYERVGVNSVTGYGTVTLNAKKTDFTTDTKYWVILLANCSLSSEELSAVSSRTNLLQLIQSDEHVHLSAYPGGGVDAPTTFLMDGTAHLKSETEPSVANSVILNDGNIEADTELAVTLRRAAAKMFVTINAGRATTATGTWEVQFDTTQLGSFYYYIRNLAYTSTLLSGQTYTPEVTTCARNSGSYIDIDSSRVTVLAYSYSNDWSNSSQLERETRLVVNLPIVLYQIDPDTNARLTDADGNFITQTLTTNRYQVRFTNTGMLNRNTYYASVITVAAAGSQQPDDPIELTDVQYNVYDWTDVPFNIGDSDEAYYLDLNRNDLTLSNIESDNATIVFASSSNVSLAVSRAYYIDKFGQEVDVDLTLDTDGNYIGQDANGDEIRISATAPAGITGTINLYSTLPTNNAVRYIDITVTNQNNLSQTLTVAQYPLEYITNTQAWYSYRSDFVYGNGVTNYETINGIAVTSGTYSNSDNSRIDSGEGRYVAISYETSTWSGEVTSSYSSTAGGDFISRVATLITSGTEQGQSDIYNYYWSENSSGGRFNRQYSYTRSTSSAGTNLDNARMYHVKITSTSEEYTVGIPNQTAELDNNGDTLYTYTSHDDANALLVSPSFMIASQLGATQPMTRGDYNSTNHSIAEEQCGQYVEVYQKADGTTVHLDDWRLPTAAEVAIIIKFQNNSEVMDEVLGGVNYWTASGYAENQESEDWSEYYTNTNCYIRCIRDGAPE